MVLVPSAGSVATEPRDLHFLPHANPFSSSFCHSCGLCPQGICLITVSAASSAALSGLTQRTENSCNAIFICNLHVSRLPVAGHVSAHLATCCCKNTTLGRWSALVIY